MNRLISGLYGLEVIMTGKKVSFPYLSQLNNKRIKHIDVFNVASLPKTHNGTTVITDTENMYLTVVEQNSSKQLVQNLSVDLLNVNGARLFINKIIDWEHSYIEYKGVENQAGKAIFFVVHYDEPKAWNIVQSNNRTALKDLSLLLTGKKTYFAENLDLKGKMFQNMFLSFPDYTAFGADVIPFANASNKFITLSKDNLEFIQNVPLIEFYQGTDFYPLRLQNITFDFQSSYIQTLDTAADDLKTVLFNCILDDNQ